MAKSKFLYQCTECGAQASKWAGQCPDCGAWNSLTEALSVVSAAGKAARFSSYAGDSGVFSPGSNRGFRSALRSWTVYWAAAWWPVRWY
jgi:predicted ATP-dependent serine protease